MERGDGLGVDGWTQWGCTMEESGMDYKEGQINMSLVYLSEG